MKIGIYILLNFVLKSQSSRDICDEFIKTYKNFATHKTLKFILRNYGLDF